VDEAGVRKRVTRWLGQLADIGVRLAGRISRVAASREENPDVTITVDLRLGWSLVARAMRWTRALRARLAAEDKAAKPPGTERRANLYDAAVELFGRRLPEDREPAEKTEDDDCIEGKPAVEVVAQIFADLGTAATMLHSPSSTRKIAAIADAARALLGEPDEAWTPLPVVITRAPASHEQPARLSNGLRLVLAPVPCAVPVPLPDTG
jgi:hypothetical protein